MNQASEELAVCFLSCLLSSALDKNKGTINMQNALAEIRMQESCLNLLTHSELKLGRPDFTAIQKNLFHCRFK